MYKHTSENRGEGSTEKKKKEVPKQKKVSFSTLCNLTVEKKNPVFNQFSKVIKHG